MELVEVGLLEWVLQAALNVSGNTRMKVKERSVLRIGFVTLLSEVILY